MRALLSAFSFAAVAAFAAAPVHAEARHDQVAVKPIKDKATGHVVGAKLSVILFPENGHTRVKVGIGRTDKRLFGSGSFDHMPYADDPKLGHLLVQFPEEAKLTPNVPVEKTYTIMYGKDNELKGGEKVEVISTWRGGDTWYNPGGKDAALPHVWGMNRSGVGNPTYTLPQ